MRTTAEDEQGRRWVPRLLEVQRDVREALSRASSARGDLERASEVVRDDDGDTIFAIDVDAEEALLRRCEAWGRDACFRLVAEGLDPGGIVFGSGEPELRLIVDPIDGTRGLMFDKRSAWSLGAIANERDGEARLTDVLAAAMTELPTTRQGQADVLWAVRGGTAEGRRVHLGDGREVEAPVRPSRATTIRHGFATVCSFFQGGKELTARFEEDLIGAVLGGWDHRKAEVYVDQYISSGGQLAEVALGRDRFVLDLRPWVHRALGFEGTLCSKPYDVCTALVAQAAGCVVEAPDGAPLDPPLDVTTNVAFVAYANEGLAEVVRPHLIDALRRHGLGPG
jgi:hypothetical protein